VARLTVAFLNFSNAPINQITNEGTVTIRCRRRFSLSPHSTYLSGLCQRDACRLPSISATTAWTEYPEDTKDINIPRRPMSTGRLSIAKNITNYCVGRMSRWHNGNEGLGELVYPLLSTASWTHMSGRIPPLILKHRTTSDQRYEPGMEPLEPTAHGVT